MSRKLSQEEILRKEIDEIKKHRWLESEKAGYDIGSYAAATDWIEKYAAEFRKHWEDMNDDQRNDCDK